MRIFSILFLIFTVMSVLPVAAQGPNDAQSSSLVTMAKDFVSLLSGGKFSEAYNRFDQTMKTALPEEKLKETWSTLITQAGAFQKQGETRTEERDGYTTVIVTCAFEKAPIDIRVVFNRDKRVAGLFFAPAAK